MKESAYLWTCYYSRSKLRSVRDAMSPRQFFYECLWRSCSVAGKVLPPGVTSLLGTWLYPKGADSRVSSSGTLPGHNVKSFSAIVIRKQPNVAFVGCRDRICFHVKGKSSHKFGRAFIQVNSQGKGRIKAHFRSMGPGHGPL